MQNVTLVGPGPLAVSDGSGPYADNMKCMWNIDSSGPITIVFKTFATEEYEDVLTVFDGESGDVLGTFSGERLPAVLSTNATRLQVVFTSNSFCFDVGFELEAFALVPGGTLAPTATPTAPPTRPPITFTPTTATPTWAPDTTGVLQTAMLLCANDHMFHAHSSRSPRPAGSFAATTVTHDTPIARPARTHAHTHTSGVRLARSQTPKVIV